MYNHKYPFIDCENLYSASPRLPFRSAHDLCMAKKKRGC